jgi:hypothetical protein
VRRRIFVKLLDCGEELGLIEVEERVGPILDQDGQQVVGLLARRESVDGLSESLELG